MDIASLVGLVGAIGAILAAMIAGGGVAPFIDTQSIFIVFGGTWRLPTLDELESLVCEKCEKPKINEKYFPGISPEAYWTQTKNRFNSKMYWTVNFMTGYNYSRFFSYQQLPVLLVQDR